MELGEEVKKVNENKAEICKALVPVLQMTRNLWDLTDLIYVVDDLCGDECVIAKFTSGNQKIANVSMDSGTAMIRDIIGQIV